MIFKAYFSEYLSLFFIMIAPGIVLAYFVLIMPVEASKTLHSTDQDYINMKISQLGIVLGIFDVTAGAVMGKACDKLGNRPTLIIGISTMFIGGVFC